MVDEPSPVVNRSLNGLHPQPEGWVWTTVGDVVSFEYGKGLTQDKRDASGKVPVYGSNGIVGYHSAALIDKPCLVIGRKGAAGAVHKSEIPCWPIDTTYFAIPPENVNLSFLYYLFLTLDLASLDRSTAIPGLNRNDVYAVNIPLPPLPEQKRIVARLEELLSDLEAGVAALGRVRAGAKRYKASVLKAACEGKLFGDKGIENGELPEGWRWVTVGDVTVSMKNGVYKPAEYYADDGIACLRMYNIEDGAIVWKDIKRMKLTEEEVETYRLLPGDILVNRVNSRELVGKTAVIPSGLESIVYESKNIRLKIKQDIADSTYINYCFGAYRQRYFNFNAQQVVGMASINQTQIAQMPIPLPPLEEQRRIVVEVERRLESARAVESAVEVGLKRAGRLRQAVLRSAFEGRLVS